MKESGNNKMLSKIGLAAIVALGLFILAKACTTLSWPMELDSPLLMYEAFLMDKFHFVPYRNMFVTDMPGALFFYYGIGKLLGYGAMTFRIVDLTLLGGLMAATYRFMRRFGRYAALWSIFLFALVYLGKGPMMSLERDYVAVIPVAFALLFIPEDLNVRVGLGRFAGVGFLFGLSAIIKPPMAIAFPVIPGTLLAFRWNTHPRSRVDFFKCVGISVGAMLTPLFFSVIWLSANSALKQFLSMFFNYLPLHVDLTYNVRTISGWHRIAYLSRRTFMLGGPTGWVLFLTAIIGGAAALKRGNDSVTRRSAICLILCMFAYLLYPIPDGKFWLYQWMPFYYFAALIAAVSLTLYPKVIRFKTVRTDLPHIIPIMMLLLVTVAFMGENAELVIKKIRYGPTAVFQLKTRVDEISSWLKPRLRADDTVQPLDWTGGSVHAMLLDNAKLATKFLYDYEFYHHISSPYIQGLRTEFMKELRTAKPRFVIDILTIKPWVSGKGTTRKFNRLKVFLENDYFPAYKGNGYVIYERSKQDREPPDYPR